MRKVLTAILLALVGCGSAIPEPCSEAALLAHATACAAKIRFACHTKPNGTKDLDCPEFVQCTRESIEEETRCNAQ